MTDQEFTRHALGVLMRELGPDGRYGALKAKQGFGAKQPVPA
jgi:hypothetical protein